MTRDDIVTISNPKNVHKLGLLQQLVYCFVINRTNCRRLSPSNM